LNIAGHISFYKIIYFIIVVVYIMPQEKNLSRALEMISQQYSLKSFKKKLESELISTNSIGWFTMKDTLGLGHNEINLFFV